MRKYILLYFVSFLTSFVFTFLYLYKFDSFYDISGFDLKGHIRSNYANFLKGDFSGLDKIPSSGDTVYVDVRMIKIVR